MAKVTTVNSSRKEVQCENCGNVLPKGSGYRHWSFRYGGTHIRCMKAECNPKPWDLESNSKLATLMQANDEIDSARGCDSAEAAASYVNSAVQMVTEVKDEMEEAVSAWQDGNLANAQRTYDWEEAVGELDDWCTTAEGWASDLEGLVEADEDGRHFITDYDDEACEESEACTTYRDELDSTLQELEDAPDIHLG